MNSNYKITLDKIKRHVISILMDSPLWYTLPLPDRLNVFNRTLGYLYE